MAKHFPGLDETQKGHMKGQRKGVRSKKDKPMFKIKIEPETDNSPPTPIGTKKMNDIFVKTYKLVEEIHTDQTGAFPVTLQQGY